MSKHKRGNRHTAIGVQGQLRRQEMRWYEGTQEVVTAAASTWPAGRMITHRNRVNVGGNANVLRCLEKAESERAWIIGDDDIPEQGALARVAMALAENPQGLKSWFTFLAMAHGPRRRAGERRHRGNARQRQTVRSSPTWVSLPACASLRPAWVGNWAVSRPPSR